MDEKQSQRKHCGTVLSNLACHTCQWQELRNTPPGIAWYHHHQEIQNSDEVCSIFPPGWAISKRAAWGHWCTARIKVGEFECSHVLLNLYHSACAQSLRHVQLFATPWTIACQAPLSTGVFQATILEWVAISSTRGSSWPRNWTYEPVSPTLVGRFFFFFNFWATWEASNLYSSSCYFKTRWRVKVL